MSLRVPYKAHEVIRQAADECRKRFATRDELPVNAEIALERAGLTLIFADRLKEVWDIDAAYIHQHDQVIADREIFFNEIYFPRCRFTLAHELGHFVMHRHYLKALSFKSDEEYLAFRRDNAGQLDRAEYQAHEFAGRFLVPQDNLITECRRIFPIVRERTKGSDDFLEQLALRLGKRFGVTPQVAQIRIERENLRSILLARFSN